MSLHDDALCPKKGGMVRQRGRLGNRPIFLFRVKLTETAEKTDEPCGMLHHYAVDCCKSPLKKKLLYRARLPRQGECARGFRSAHQSQHRRKGVNAGKPLHQSLKLLNR